MDVNEIKQLWLTFDGRATRSDYWLKTFLPFFILSIVAGIIDGLLGMGLFGLLVSLASIIPGLFVGIKRLHDRDMSGWFMLLILVPFIGWLALLVIIGFLPGTQGENKYGPDPLASAA